MTRLNTFHMDFPQVSSLWNKYFLVSLQRSRLTRKKKNKQLKIRCDKCGKIYQFYSLVDKSNSISVHRAPACTTACAPACAPACLLYLRNQSRRIWNHYSSILLRSAFLFYFFSFFFSCFVHGKLIQLMEYFAMQRMVSANNIVNKT